jgi:hypothetical protein
MGSGAGERKYMGKTNSTMKKEGTAGVVLHNKIIPVLQYAEKGTRKNGKTDRRYDLYSQNSRGGGGGIW